MYIIYYIYILYMYIYQWTQKVCSLMTLHTFVFTHVTSMVKPVHIFMERSRVFKSRLKAELWYTEYISIWKPFNDVLDKNKKKFLKHIFLKNLELVFLEFKNFYKTYRTSCLIFMCSCFTRCYLIIQCINALHLFVLFHCV